MNILQFNASVYQAKHTPSDTPFMTYDLMYVVNGVSQTAYVGLYIDFLEKWST